MKYVYSALFAFTLMSEVFGQEKQPYLETNVGLSYIDDYWEVAPGFSFLYGRQTYVSETSFWDVQYGLAAPSIVTMKVGRGVKNPRTGRTVSGGLRIFPAHFYLQLGFPNPRCSNEVSKRMKKRLKRRGSDRTNLLCGEWNFSLEAGLGNTDYWELSFMSIAIVTMSHRWYFE